MSSPTTTRKLFAQQESLYVNSSIIPGADAKYGLPLTQPLSKLIAADDMRQPSVGSFYDLAGTGNEASETEDDYAPPLPKREREMTAEEIAAVEARKTQQAAQQKQTGIIRSEDDYAVPRTALAENAYCFASSFTDDSHFSEEGAADSDASANTARVVGDSPDGTPPPRPPLYTMASNTGQEETSTDTYFIPAFRQRSNTGVYGFGEPAQKPAQYELASAQQMLPPVPARIPQRAQESDGDATKPRTYIAADPEQPQKYDAKKQVIADEEMDALAKRLQSYTYIADPQHPNAYLIVDPIKRTID